MDGILKIFRSRIYPTHRNGALSSGIESANRSIQKRSSKSCVLTPKHRVERCGYIFAPPVNKGRIAISRWFSLFFLFDDIFDELDGTRECASTMVNNVSAVLTGIPYGKCRLNSIGPLRWQERPRYEPGS